jgi:very-short-patch-repair endonuclease
MKLGGSWDLRRVDKADELDFQFKARNPSIPKYAREFLFHPLRKWRLDFAFEEARLAVEVNGGVYVSGGHTRGKAYENDCEKYAHLAIMNWRLIVVTPKQVKSGLALLWIERALGIKI